MPNATLFDLTYRVASELGVMEEGKVDSGTTSTLVDDERDEPDDFWNKGTIWIVRTTDGAAPQGEIARVTDFVASSDTLTVDSETSFSTAPDAGDDYAIAKRRYPLDILTGKINEALRDLGPYELSDSTSITTAANQSEYDLPLVASHDLREVYIQSVDDSDDNQWKPIHDWDIIRTAIGSQDKLVIPAQHRSGVPLLLKYVAEHPQLYDATDELAESVSPDLIVTAGILNCLYWRRQKVGQMDQTLPEQITRYERKLYGDGGQVPGVLDRRGQRPPAVQPRLLIVGKNQRRYPGDRTPR